VQMICVHFIITNGLVTGMTLEIRAQLALGLIVAAKNLSNEITRSY
jgi:hypothetical protein